MESPWNVHPLYLAHVTQGEAGARDPVDNFTNDRKYYVR